MQLKHLRTVIQPEDDAPKIVSVAWAPNNNKLAVCLSDRNIYLFDELGEQKDKFSTKPRNLKYGRKSYVVRSIAFSPDSTKIAVGQSDSIVFVYKIGEEWGDKKVICNKFIQQTAVTCLIWLSEGYIILGQTDGRVRAANVKNNKAQTLYNTPSYVVSLAPNTRGTGFLSGHADGAIVRWYISDDVCGEKGRVVIHPVPPYALAWPVGSILAGGSDKRVLVYNTDGHVAMQFDYSGDDTEKEFTIACSSPSGQAVAVGSFDRLRVYTWSPRKSMWEEDEAMEIPFLYSVTALSWKRDGSRVAVGSLSGALELFESVLKRTIWKNKFELTFVGPSQVLVKPLAPGSRGVILKSSYGYEIDDVRIMGQDNYLVARTPETLLLGDLQNNLLSEILWSNSGQNEKFYFNNPSVCHIFNAGELSLVEYGSNEILGSVRTEFMNPHQISVRLNERKLNSFEDNKKLAYLLDVKTICILDLVTGGTVAQLPHDSRIDWLELNETGNKLLFRDKKKRLTLFDVAKDQKTSILSYCTVVQWVEGSDVVVAQSRNNLCIWYNIDVPDQKTIVTIKGDVVDVVRMDGKTEVIIQEGNHQYGYQLDEGLVEFGTAINDNDLNRAVDFLEQLGEKPEAEGMWNNLGEIALNMNNLPVAERSFAALGDGARVQYLLETMQLLEQQKSIQGAVDAAQHYEIRARLAILDNRLQDAENIYLELNLLDEVISMYQNLQKWDEALSLAARKGHPKYNKLRDTHIQWLMRTGQDERAGEVMERENDLEAAITFYLKAKLPTRASRLLQNHTHLLNDDELFNKVISALFSEDMLEQAGDLLHQNNQTQKAYDCYRKGHAYAKAIDLARTVSPSDVVLLEEQWGDYLVENKQLDAAVNHFIEAGKMKKALEASISARQWKKASQIILVFEEPAPLKEYFQKIAEHFSSTKDYEAAERMYIKAKLYKEAVKMYNDTGNWNRAHQLASQYLDVEQVSAMYMSQAEALEEEGKLREAEKLYIFVSDPDAAISMYKKRRQYDNMMRLVKQYHPDLVITTHLHLAQELEAEKNYKVAERHFLSAGDWKGCINMYRAANMWEEAYAVARSNGGPQAANRVAFSWAKSLGGDPAVKLLSKLNLLEISIDYACENYEFEFAFEIARQTMKPKLLDIHYKYAAALEDSGKFKQAEEQYILARKPKKAVLMYIHTQDWNNAYHVAEKYDPASLPEVLQVQAKQAFDAEDYQRFESLLLRAEKPELIVKLYRDAGMWAEALRVCREYLPGRYNELQNEYDKEVTSKTSTDANSLLLQAREWEKNHEFKAAIDCLIQINESNTKDSSTVVKAWIEAADLSNRFLDAQDAVDVARILGPRLRDVHQYKAAAQLFLSVDMTKEAIDTFIFANDWNKAKKVAQELDPSLEPYVDSRYKETLRSQGQADKLADVDVISALDLLAERGQWAKCMEMASHHGSEVLHKYLAIYATQLIKDGLPLKALTLYTKYGAPPFSQNYNIYKRIALDVFAERGLSSSDSYPHWAQLRNMLFQLTEAMNTSSDASSAVHMDFEKLLLISHYYAARAAFKGVESLEDLAVKLSISLLRYTDIIPADKGYLEAGLDTKEVDRENEAFVFLNHYLDLYEAIEEGNLENLDFSDFSDNTDFPMEIPLPVSHYATADIHEAVKEWVLSVSVDQRIEQELPVDERKLYPAALSSPKQKGPTAPACIITGYPVIVQRGRLPVELRRSGKANRDDWNKTMMVAKLSPDSEVTDVLTFIHKWCGNSSSFSFH